MELAEPERKEIFRVLFKLLGNVVLSSVGEVT
jgi:hypothetical protein